MKSTRRLERLYPELSAKERALLVLQSWKEGQEEDPGWRLTMPPEQVPEFNRYIGLMNGVNRRLGLGLYAIAKEVEKLSLRLGWLVTLTAWGIRNFELASYIALETKEPITESEYRELVEKERARFVPVGELAELLVERYEEWSEDDLAPDENHHDEVIVTEEGWDRLRKAKRRELATLVGRGTLQGKGKGSRLQVNVGSFFEWLGEEPKLWPEWGLAYDVLPDDQADLTESRRQMRQRARDSFQAGPGLPGLYLENWPEALTIVSEPGEKQGLDDLVAVHKELIRGGIEEQWRQLEAMGIVVAEVAAEFGGEDPAVPDVRHMLDHTTERLVDLHKDAQIYVEPFELGEPGEEDVAAMRDQVERELEEAT